MLKTLSKQRKRWSQTLGITSFMIFMTLMSLYTFGINETRDKKLEALRFGFDSLVEKLNAVNKDLIKLIDNSNAFEANDRKKRSAKKPFSTDYYSALGGAVYVRWGRTTCPTENGTEQVYTGIAGGSHSTHGGAATNVQCLPSVPEWGRFDDGSSSMAFMYGMEYEDNMDNILHHSNLEGSLVQHNVPCVVCRNKVRPSSLMIPGKFSCFEGWNFEYRGYIMAGHYKHNAGSQYICLDETPEADPAGYRDENGALLYRVETICGSLPCPPYVANRELACVLYAPNKQALGNIIRRHQKLALIDPLCAQSPCSSMCI